MKTVLLIDDDREFLDMWSEELRKLGVNLLAAVSIEEAWRIFVINLATVDLIVMDACVPGHTPTTLALSREIRAAGFTGPMLATSSTPEYRIKQLESGCDYSTEKCRVVLKIIELLKLNSQ